MENKNISIQPLTWDSEFFKISIGKLHLSVAHLIDEENINALHSGYDLIYVFSPSPLEQSLENIYLADIKIIYHCFLNEDDSIHDPRAIQYFEKIRNSYDDLLRLAYLSGTYSRFRLDKKFPAGSFKRLYKRWIDNSIQDQNTLILVKKDADNLVGFVTVELLADNQSKIGLIAVDPTYQGRSIGSELVRDAIFVAKDAGRTMLEVATQKNNIPACTLYEKNLFTIKEQSFIYHLWKQ